jgi:hypothetical protein
LRVFLESKFLKYCFFLFSSTSFIASIYILITHGVSSFNSSIELASTRNHSNSGLVHKKYEIQFSLYSSMKMRITGGKFFICFS